MVTAFNLASSFRALCASVAFAALAGATATSALAAGSTGTVNASLLVSGECEVLVTNIGATTPNFVAGNVTLAKTANLDPENFDNAPTGTTIDAASTVAVLCSASATNHTLNLTSGDTVMDGTGGNTDTLAWSPVVAPENSPVSTTPIVTADGTDIELTADADDASLHEYIVTATVAADAIANVVPDTYSQTISVTVSYVAP